MFSWSLFLVCVGGGCVGLGFVRGFTVVPFDRGMYSRIELMSPKRRDESSHQEISRISWSL